MGSAKNTGCLYIYVRKFAGQTPRGYKLCIKSGIPQAYSLKNRVMHRLIHIIHSKHIHKTDVLRKTNASISDIYGRREYYLLYP